MLGVIVEVTVKLLPLPERAQVVLAAFDDEVKAGAAVGEIIAAGIIPAGFEMMDRLAIQAAEDFVHAGYPLTAEATLLREVDGTNEEVSEHILHIHDILAPCAPRSRRTARVCRGCAGCARTLHRWCRRLRTTKSPRRRADNRHARKLTPLVSPASPSYRDL